MKKLFCTFFVAVSLPLLAASLQLKNDAVMELTASVLSATGDLLDTVQLQPGEFKIWTTELSRSEKIKDLHKTKISLTPFTVIWRCQEGDVYSMCNDAASGAFVSARSCPGARACKPPPKPDESQTQLQMQNVPQPQQKVQPSTKETEE